MDLRTTGMEFASEMVIKATLMNLKIVEVPTTLSPDGRSRPPHLKPWRDGWRHLRFMLLFSPNWLFLYPGIALILIGSVLGGLLVTGPIRLGNIRFSLDTLIYCATMIEIGFQSVLFMLLSHTFAVQEGLFPKPKTPTLFQRLFRLERGLLFGGFLFAAGFALAVHAIQIWSRAQFSSLDIEYASRVVITSAVFSSIGFEIILSSLLLSMLQLNVRVLRMDDLTVAQLEMAG